MPSPLPKPARRGPKPRKPIARSRLGIARKRSIRAAKPTRLQRTEREADAAWSAAVLRRSGGRCECGCGRPATDAHHFVSRRVRATRWRLECGAALTRECHKRCHEGVGYTRRNERLAVALLGPEGWLGLCERAAVPSRVNPAEELERLRAEATQRMEA